ncbi:MAG TPA: molybdenum cofactor biosynthesis protein MoaE [Acidimicrobiales bacterium]|jgi:molybdopterin synthase catalytic subunit
MRPPTSGDVWLGLARDTLPVERAMEWAVRPDCGAVVLFSGTARDHAPDRPDVRQLEYEAYEEQVVPRLQTVAAEARTRWPAIGRVVLLHRIGVVPIGSSAVVVVVSAPHRPEAFEAARFCIDAVKSSVPIWKHEVWDGGDAWGDDTQVLVPAHDVRQTT